MHYCSFWVQQRPYPKFLLYLNIPPYKSVWTHLTKIFWTQNHFWIKNSFGILKFLLNHLRYYIVCVKLFEPRTPSIIENQPSQVNQTDLGPIEPNFMSKTNQTKPKNQNCQTQTKLRSILVYKINPCQQGIVNQINTILSINEKCKLVPS